jgi:hypothetical protein
VSAAWVWTPVPPCGCSPGGGPPSRPASYHATSRGGARRRWLRWVHVRRRAAGTDVAALLREIAALKNEVRALARLARTDPLTGLANRRGWDEQLERELARARRSGAAVSVALFDFDNFKGFNDTHGHQAGDRLLVAAAAAWQRQCARSTSSAVGAATSSLSCFRTAPKARSRRSSLASARTRQACNRARPALPPGTATRRPTICCGAPTRSYSNRRSTPRHTVGSTRSSDRIPNPLRSLKRSAPDSKRGSFAATQPRVKPGGRLSVKCPTVAVRAPATPAMDPALRPLPLRLGVTEAAGAKGDFDPGAGCPRACFVTVSRQGVEVVAVAYSR